MYRSAPKLKIRRGVVAALACVFISGAASAQGVADDVAVATRLRSGDAFSLEVTRVRENSSRPEQNGRSTTPVDVRVATAGPDGVTLEWVPGESRIESSAARLDPLVLAASNALQGLRLRLTLNADGEYEGLANQDDVLPQVQKAVDLIVGGVMQKVPAEQRAGMQRLLGQVLSPAALLGTITRDAEMYFGLHGISLAVGESADVDLEQPNPLGAGVLPARFHVTMESATPESAVLTTATTYDGAALLRITRTLLEQSGQPIPESELAGLPALQMNDDGRFVVDRQLGLIRELVVNRRVTMGKDQRLDRWEMRLVRVPQR
jgi:hypothetical protein